MRKPSVYYQFDQDKFFSQHYNKGYFDYEKGFGEVVRNKRELVDAIKEYIDLAFVPKAEYVQRMEMFFELYDNRNCERVYEAIEALK
jgi:CDP-glycerol glycerophosphotransferase (TagB/SpsB family)